jgi:hypothetical protein
MDLSALSDDFEENKKSNGGKRRVTNIHVGGTIGGYIKLPSENHEDLVAKEALKPITDYHFESRGLSSRNTLQRKLLTWKAEFDSNIDHFIYPSLQTVGSNGPGDSISYELKKQRAQELHGHYDNQVRDRNLRRDSSAIEVSKLSGGSNIGRETMVNKILDLKKNLKFVQNPLTVAAHQIDANMIGESSQPINLEEFAEKPLSWTVELVDIPSEYVLEGKKKTEFEEKVNKAEDFLRSNIKGHYHKMLVEKLQTTREANIRKASVLSPGAFAADEHDNSILPLYVDSPKKAGRAALFEKKEKFSNKMFAPGDKLVRNLCLHHLPIYFTNQVFFSLLPPSMLLCLQTRGQKLNGTKAWNQMTVREA